MAEMLFQMRESKIETKIVYWMFPQKSEWLETFNTYRDDNEINNDVNEQTNSPIENG